MPTITKAPLLDETGQAIVEAIEGLNNSQIPPGGLEDDVLTKTSSTDYDLKWSKPLVKDVTMNGTSVVSGKIAAIETVDILTSTSLAPLSAKQGKALNDRINNLLNIGRFLSIWNCSTGLPLTSPTSLPYQYHTGDYYRVGNADSIKDYTPYNSSTIYNTGDKCTHAGAYYICNEDNVTGEWDATKWTVHTIVNYQPSGSSYTGAASTTVCSTFVNVNDVFYYDGTNWSISHSAVSDTITDVLVDDTSIVTGSVAIITADNLPNLSASKITSGTINVARIPDLNTSKITSGELSTDRLPIIPDSKILSSNIWNSKQSAIGINPTETSDVLSSIEINGTNYSIAKGITSISAGTGLTGGTITSTGTIGLEYPIFYDGTSSETSASVKTLYTDALKTTGLYPRTKTTAITDYENNTLDAILLQKQNALVSSQNIKSINGQSILGPGNLQINSGVWGNITGVITDQTDLQTKFGTKQDTLVSGTNIKTINNESILSSGNIQLQPLMTTSTVTVTTTDWIEDSTNSVYYQDINLQGISATDSPWVDVQLSGSKSSMEAQLANYHKILTIYTLENKLRIIASDQTTTQIILVLKK